MANPLAKIIAKHKLSPCQVEVFNTILGLATQLIHEEHGESPVQDIDDVFSGGDLFIELFNHPAIAAEDGANLRNALIEALEPLAPDTRNQK